MSALMVLGSFMDEGAMLALLYFFLLSFSLPGTVAIWETAEPFITTKVENILRKMSLSFL